MEENRIWMVALDSSPASRTAFDYCLNAMDRENDHLILVSVALEHLSPLTRLARKIRESELQKANLIQPILSKLKNIDTAHETELSALELKHRGVAMLYAQQAHDCGVAHYSAFVGVATHIGELLVEAAKSNDVNFLVLGTKEIGKAQSLFFGSTCRYVVDNAPCDVIIARKVFGEEALHDTSATAIQLEEDLERRRRLRSTVEESERLQRAKQFSHKIEESSEFQEHERLMPSSRSREKFGRISSESRERAYPRERREATFEPRERSEARYETRERSEATYEPRERREAKYEPRERREATYYEPRERREETYEPRERREETYEPRERREAKYEPREPTYERQQINAYASPKPVIPHSQRNVPDILHTDWSHDKPSGSTEQYSKQQRQAPQEESYSKRTDEPASSAVPEISQRAEALQEQPSHSESAGSGYQEPTHSTEPELVRQQQREQFHPEKQGMESRAVRPIGPGLARGAMMRKEPIEQQGPLESKQQSEQVHSSQSYVSTE